MDYVENLPAEGKRDEWPRRAIANVDDEVGLTDVHALEVQA